MAIQLSKGDKVKILNEKAVGIIKKILGKNLALVQVGDFDYEFPINQLVVAQNENNPSSSEKKQKKKLIPEFNSEIRKKILFEKESPSPKTSFKKGKKSPQVREIDLHSHKIIDDSSGMSSSRILNCQLNYFMKELEYAMANKERNIIFIHGKGEGILKTEIHRILSSHDNIIYYDAPLRFYGGGATQVEIH